MQGGSHTVRKSLDSLESIISESNITTKIRSIVTDNASNMRRAMTVLFEDSSFQVDDPYLWEDEDDDNVDCRCRPGTDTGAVDPWVGSKYLKCIIFSLSVELSK